MYWRAHLLFNTLISDTFSADYIVVSMPKTTIQSYTPDIDYEISTTIELNAALSMEPIIRIPPGMSSKVIPGDASLSNLLSGDPSNLPISPYF